MLDRMVSLLQKKEFVMTRCVTDEQYGHFSRRVHGLQGRVLEGSVPFDRTMEGLQALAESDQPRLVGVTGPIYPKGTIILRPEIDLTLSLEQMIRQGEYANQKWALQNITQDRFPIDCDVPEPRYTTTVILVPPYRELITFSDQLAEMGANQMRQLGLVEMLAIGRRYPDLQYGYYILGGPSRNSEGSLNVFWLSQDKGARELHVDQCDLDIGLIRNVLCAAAP
jgi:hypothetical protein